MASQASGNTIDSGSGCSDGLLGWEALVCATVSEWQTAKEVGGKGDSGGQKKVGGESRWRAAAERECAEREEAEAIKGSDGGTGARRPSVTVK